MPKQRVTTGSDGWLQQGWASSRLVTIVWATFRSARSSARALPVLLAVCATAVPAQAGVNLFDQPEHVRRALAALVAASWLAFAVWAIIRGARAQSLANTARAWGLRLRGLLATSPTAYLLVSPDGSLICSESLRGWLGLDSAPIKFTQLYPDASRGLVTADAVRLRADIAALAASGRRFETLVRTAAGDRILHARGISLAAEVVGDGGVVVWFADATDAQRAVAVTLDEKRALEEELDAATALLEAAPFPVWRRDAQLRLRHVNTAYVKAIEAESAADVVAGDRELVNKAISAAPKKSAERARELNMAQTREENVIIEGERRTLTLIDVPLGKGGVGGFALDVTERERARDELERYTRAYNDVLNSLSKAVAIFSQGKRLVFFNRAFARLYDLPEVWLADQPHHGELLDRMRERRQIPEQADYRRWKAEQLDAYTRIVEKVEDVWHLPDGRSLRVVIQPHPFGGLLLMFEDQTEKLALARSYDELNKVQRVTLDNLHEALAVFGADGRVKLVNEGFTRTMGVAIDTLVAEDTDLDRTIERIAEALAEHTSAAEIKDALIAATVQRRMQTGRLPLADGRTLTYSTVPLPDGAAMLTLLDVTDTARIESALRERAQALEEADRIKTRFVANMSYELRTPLTSILGFVEMLDQKYLGELSPLQADYIRMILTSARRLEVLIGDILDLTVNEFGDVVLQKAPIAVRLMVESVLAMVQEQASEAGISINSVCDSSVGVIEGDERRLRQVLHNILSNSLRFTPRGGLVDVRALGTADAIEMVVRDNGVGIPEQEQESIFDLFKRGSNADGTKGIGLGLSLARRMVELHRGRLDLHSEPGVGTTITIVLPRAAEPDTGTRAP